MSLCIIGPFHGTPLGRKIEKDIWNEILHGKPKKIIPQDALKTTKAAAYLIKEVLDTANFAKQLNSSIPEHIIESINAIFLKTDYKISCLMGTTFELIEKAQYPVSLFAYKTNDDPRRTLNSIRIECYTFWEIPSC